MNAGLLLVDKPSSWTSHDVVAKVRGMLGRKTKVGHSGTLDPMATGLLILLIGRATKQAAHYQDLSKVYSGRMRLGITTESGDLEGKVISEDAVPDLDAAALRTLFGSLCGDIEMPVPRYSAVKYRGKPLYTYARRGEVVPEKRRISRLMKFELLSWTRPEAQFRLECSSGTYVRSLAELVGRNFGCGAALSALRRESVGSFSVDDALSMDRLQELRLKGLEYLVAAASPLETSVG